MLGLLVAAVVLNSLILLVVIIGAIIVVMRIGKMASAAEEALNDVRDMLVPTLGSARQTLEGIDSLAQKTEKELDTVDTVLKSVDRLVSGATVAEVAAKTIQNTRVTLSSVLAGVKEGLKTLRHPSEHQTKEGSGND